MQTKFVPAAEGRGCGQNKKASGSQIQARSCPNRSPCVLCDQGLKVSSELGSASHRAVNIGITQNLATHFKASFQTACAGICGQQECKQSCGKGFRTLHIRQLGRRQVYRLSSGDLAGQYFAVSGPGSGNVMTTGNHQSWSFDLAQIPGMVQVPKSNAAPQISCGIGSKQHRSDACRVGITLREEFRREEAWHCYVDDGCHSTLLHSTYSCFPILPRAKLRWRVSDHQLREAFRRV